MTIRCAAACVLWCLSAGLAAIAAETVDSPIIIGDLLYVDVYRHPEASVTTQVDPNGNINIPYIHLVHVAGLTESQAAARISAALSKYYRNPRVTVSREGAAGPVGGRGSNMTTQMIALNNANAESLSATLQGMTSEGGAVSYDPDTNTLVVTDTPDAIQNILSVVSRLDEMREQLTQVHLKARIAEVQVGAFKELGIRWWAQDSQILGGYYPVATQGTDARALKGLTGDMRNEDIGVGGSSQGLGRGRRFVDDDDFDRRLNVPVHVPGAGQMFFGLMDSHIDIGVLLDALIADDKAELLAEPMSTTVNHKTAEIRMVEEFPYTEFGTEISGRSHFSIEFMDLGITLAVTPHVLRDEVGPYVRLELNPVEVSYASGSSNGVPVRAVRSYNGEAKVRDGQTLAIGGIFRNDTQDRVQRVPVVSKIPVIGRLFKHKEKTKVKTELMVFVTPTLYAKPEDITWEKMINLSESLVPPPLQPHSDRGLQETEPHPHDQ